ncbi:MAG: L-threonylcarbamoyladenylate synthase [Deltaproteobacteria bacterium]|nr:L-threonylcarbamoyladenylate synthase [Deltaproteobacteria bacterium]
MIRLRIDTHIDLMRPIKRAAEVLKTGGIVAYPTETVYGLAADISNSSAIKKLFRLKQRKPNRPILMLIPSVDDLRQYTDHIPLVATQLMKRFWPGALTLIFKASPLVSPLLTGGKGKIGIRLSSHPVAAALAKEMGRPITSTSANLSRGPSPRTPDEVVDTFDEGIDLILDAGPSPGNTPSTVLDLTVDPPQILREGAIKAFQLTGREHK